MEVEEGDTLLNSTNEKRSQIAISNVSLWGFSFLFVAIVGVFVFEVESGGTSIQTLLTHDRHGPPPKSMCSNDDFTKTTLKADLDATYAALIKDKRGENKFEASDVVIIDDKFYSICDNSWSIQVIGSHFTPLDHTNYQIGAPQGDSDFESIIYDSFTDVFYLIRESQTIASVNKDEPDSYHAIVHQVKITEDGKNYTTLETCVSEFTFQDHTKGFEGAVTMVDPVTNTTYLLGLCEGNLCMSGSTGETPGNGRIVVMVKTQIDNPSVMYDGQYTCQYSTIRIIDIPKSAYFEDYSAIAVNPWNGKVAITSQQYSQIWIGDMTMHGPGNSFDPMKSELVEDGAFVYNFPRDDDCNIIYCNVEGIHWLSDSMFVGVSDKMKSGGRQDYRCRSKDQSIHLFSLP